MKVGILTFHSQLNYGGVLQCWALQTALKGLGHEVVVLDRWMDEQNGLLELGYKRWGCKEWLRFWARSLIGLGDVNRWIRARRTKCFIRDNINRTPYHFVEWGNAPKNLSVDVLVVGSDQVWHCGDWNDPRVYLLENAPEIRAIAYAASFGMAELPRYLFDKGQDMLAEPVYRKGLAKFRAISCRESEGVSICKRMGLDAAHVVDPTLLVDGGEWRRLVGNHKRTKRLVCYFIGENANDHLPELKRYAKRNKCPVDVFINESLTIGMPRNINQIFELLGRLKDRVFGRVRVHDSAGPLEFVRAFASASDVISDSFHALMFSIIFGANARMLKPKDKIRTKMFSRIMEFSDHFDGCLVVENLSEALSSIGGGTVSYISQEWLDGRKKYSAEFLKSSLNIR